ncbi:ribosomal RNA small subunit methyltransferase A [Candidatus Parvarchaeota archaeon]|nr:ribosomal RNA small subunit methyltransferase A [Candidatus Acidifodinimicrobium mancum]
MNNSKVFLKNKAIMDKIIESSELNENDIVLEIGSGDGRLTEKIAQKAKKVYAVEKDLFLIDESKVKLSNYKNIEFINQDILETTFPEDVNRIISNLPYSIASPITERIIRFLNKHRNSIAVLMYQKEFGERMLAIPGYTDYSMLTVFCTYTCYVSKVVDVSKSNFRPIPSVDSVVIKLKPKNIEIDDNFIKFCKLIFQHKKKNVYTAIISSRSKLKTSDKNLIREKLNNVDQSYLKEKVFFLSLDSLMDLYKKVVAAELW